MFVGLACVRMSEVGVIADDLCGWLQKVVQLMGAAIMPLLSSLSDALEAIILTMHQEDFSG